MLLVYTNKNKEQDSLDIPREEINKHLTPALHNAPMFMMSMNDTLWNKWKEVYGKS